MLPPRYCAHQLHARPRHWPLRLALPDLRVDMVLRCYAGLEIRDNVLWLHPALPPELPRTTLEIVYRGQPIHVELTRERVSLALQPHPGPPATVCVQGRTSVLSPGELHVVALTPEGGSHTTAPVSSTAISSPPGDHRSSIREAP